MHLARQNLNSAGQSLFAPFLLFLSAFYAATFNTCCIAAQSTDFRSTAPTLLSFFFRHKKSCIPVKHKGKAKDRNWQEGYRKHI